MGAEELLDGVGVRSCRVGGDEGVEEVEEPFGGARGEGVDGVGDDVGVDVLVEVEADGAATRTCVLLIVVGTVGIPAKSERRTVTGVEARWMCGARVSEVASFEGVNVPVSRMPFAWAGRKPG